MTSSSCTTARTRRLTSPAGSSGHYSATGVAGGSTTLTGSVAPRHSYLVQLGKGTGGATPLPTPDATGTQQ